jgi:hypothetical protein
MREKTQQSKARLMPTPSEKDLPMSAHQQNPVLPQTAAGKLTNPRSQHPWGVAKIAIPLIAFLSALALTAAPALAAAPEKPLTEAASAVTATTATLNGEPAPLAEATVGYDFTLNTNATCEPGIQTPPVAEALIAAGVKEAEPVTGLEPNKEYTFCLNASNLEGSTPGNIEPFTTLGLAPAIDSEAASAVGSTAATLEAQVNPQNEPTSFVFEYSTQATGETLEGTITKVPGAEPLAAEFGDRLATVPRVEGLTPGTTYFYRVVAEDATGLSEGHVQSFTTPPAPFTDAVESVTATSATLNGHFTLTEAAATQYSFAYKRGEGAECAGEFATPLEEAGTGTVEAKETASISELQPFSKYTVCFDTTNAFGTQQGPAVSFETPPLPPGVANESSSAVTQTGATLNVGINPNNQETSYAFEYSTSKAELETGVPCCSIITGSLVAAFGEQPVSVTVGSLQPRTTYFYRVSATNASSEASQGEVESFTTLATPLLTVAPAEHITRTTATLSGTVNPGGVPTTYHFVYVEAAHFLAGAGECGEGHPACAYEGEGSRSTPQSESVGSDYTAHAAGPTQIGELKPGTAYDYALVATNSLGTRVSANQEFTTSPATPPSASTGEASGVTQLSATISGTADTQGLPGTLSFQVALSPEGGSLEAATVSGSESGTSVSITFSFGPYLQPGTTYYYRAYATNADGTAAGEWRSFTTGTFLSPFPISTPFPLLQIPSEAKESPGKATPPITRAQKLKKALKACHKLKKSKRAKCQRQARKKYAPAKKK